MINLNSHVIISTVIGKTEEYSNTQGAGPSLISWKCSTFEQKHNRCAAHNTTCI